MNLYVVTRHGWDIDIAIVRAETPEQAQKVTGWVTAEVTALEVQGEVAVLWEYTDNGPDSR